MEVSSAFLKRAAQSPRRLPNSIAAPSMKNDHMAWTACVQVCGYDFQCTHTCRFVARPSPQDFGMISDKMKND